MFSFIQTILIRKHDFILTSHSHLHILLHIRMDCVTRVKYRMDSDIEKHCGEKAFLY